MKRCFMYLLAAILVLSGCTAKLPQRPQNSPQITVLPLTSAPSAAPSLSPDTSAIDEIKALLPDKTGFQWQYFGFAEYAMTMGLKSIDQSNGLLSYSTEGKVADMSGGGTSGNYNVQVVYKAMPGVLMQELKGEKAMDNIYPNLELIRAPLKKGTTWIQAVRSSKGKNENLSCTITDVKDANGHKVYLITYQTQGSAYYEKREITEGTGITAFDRLYEFEDTNSLIGYRLYVPEMRANMTGWEQWLPKLGQQYTYFGLAEYGHKGTLTKLSAGQDEEIYEYNGVYADGSGRDDKFKLRYHVDMRRGTVTEQVVSNERGTKEVNSKLHNLVLLQFPVAKGNKWSHPAKLNGKAVTVQAVVTEYDEAKGIIKVRYTAKDAAGYYNNTYIENRTFEKGYGLTGFGNLLPGNIGISTADAKDPRKVEDALAQHMFGYSMNKTLVK